MKQNADFKEGISQAQNTATPLHIPRFLTTTESFQMRYYTRIFFKGHENCQGVKVKISEKGSFQTTSSVATTSRLLILLIFFCCPCLRHFLFFCCPCLRHFPHFNFIKSGSCHGLSSLSGSIRVCQGPTSGSVQVPQCLSGSVRCQGSIKTM